MKQYQMICIEAVRVKDGTVAGQGMVETDGFFIVEKLTAGKYELRINGDNKEVTPLDIDIPEGVYWVCGIRCILSRDSVEIPILMSP